MQDSGRALHPIPRNRGKEPIISDEADALADDELSLGSSPPLGPLPVKNTRARLRKRTSHHFAFNNVVSDASRQVRREASRGQYQPDQAVDDASILPTSAMPSMPFVHPAFGTGPTFYMLPAAPIREPDDMLSSPLGQHILDYKPARRFAIPAFTMFEGSADPYNHMLHYNQAMILNADNDRLLCKVFPASL